MFGYFLLSHLIYQSQKTKNSSHSHVDMKLLNHLLSNNASGCVPLVGSRGVKESEEEGFLCRQVLSDI